LRARRSRLASTYQACPLQFFFRGNEAPALDTLLAVYQDAWQDTRQRVVRFAKREDQDTLSKLAERVLVAFQHSSLAQPAGRLIGIEEELRGCLVPGRPDLLARVDLIQDDDSELIVTDFKTSRSVWGQGKAEASAEQLLLYHELVRPLAGGKTVRLKFAVISKAKVPAIELHEVLASRQRTERTKRIVESVWKGITMGLFYPAPSAITCPNCPFSEPCRAWNG
jgi:hypothetical protein